LKFQLSIERYFIFRCPDYGKRGNVLRIDFLKRHAGFTEDNVLFGIYLESECENYPGNAAVIELEPVLLTFTQKSSHDPVITPQSPIRKYREMQLVIVATGYGVALVWDSIKWIGVAVTMGNIKI
jgi:hypothetical protein